MVEAAGGAHHGRDLERVVDDVGPLLARADRHDHALGRIDHGLEILDSVHAHIAEARGAALILLRLELAVAREPRELLHLRRDRRDALGVRADDDRGDQPGGDRYRDRDVGADVFEHMVAGKGDVAFGHLDQRLGERLDHQIVDAEFHAAALEALVELAPELEQRVELDVDGQIDVRDLLLGLGQAARDGLADVRELDLFVRDRLLHRPRHDEMAGKRRCGRRSWCAGRHTHRRLADRGVDVGTDDPPAGAAALNARQIDVLGLREAPRERRRFYPLLPLSPLAGEGLGRGGDRCRWGGRSLDWRLRRR